MTEHTINLDALRFDIENGGHSVFSPSGSAMWLTCSGSLIPNILAPDDSGEEAAYGTVGHGVGEEWLKTRVRPDHRIGEVVPVVNGDRLFNITIDRGMIEYVSEYVDWCKDLPGDHFVEQKVYFDALTPIPRQGGTMDHAACAPGVAVVTDLKLGEGVQVFAAEDINDPRSLILVDGMLKPNGNTQGMLYALGLVYAHDWIYGFDEIVIRIAQPRLGHFQTWKTTKRELLRFAYWAKARAYAAWEPNAPRTPSLKGCQWCKVKGTCAAFPALMNAIAEDCFDDVTEVTPGQMSDALVKIERTPIEWLPHIASMTVEQMVMLVGYRRMFEKWFSDIAEQLEKRAENGEHIPGMKLVEARSFRRWNVDKARLEEELEFLGVSRDKLYKTDMLSPAQIEELLIAGGMRKKQAEKCIAKLVSKPPGKATLVPDSDPRERIGQVADDCFDDLDSSAGL